MKKVISTSLAVMTVLMGCSFSKDTSNEKLERQYTTSSKPDSRLQEEIRLSSVATIAELLKRISADELNRPFSDGTTPLEVAVERENISIINLLIKSGASPFIKNRETNMSLFEEYLFAKKEDKNRQIYITRQTTVFNAQSFIQHKFRHLISIGLYQDFYDLVIHNNVPASVVLNCLSNRSIRNRIPQEIMEKLLISPSFENDLTIPLHLKEPYSLFFTELEQQLNSTLPSFSLLEFISRKTPNNIYGYVHHDEKDDRTYFVNPGVLLEWRNIKAPPKHQDKVKKIETLSNFPIGAAALYCEGNCKFTSRDRKTISIDDLRNKEEFFNSPLLDNALDSRSNSFWDTTGEDER